MDSSAIIKGTVAGFPVFLPLYLGVIPPELQIIASLVAGIVSGFFSTNFEREYVEGALSGITVLLVGNLGVAIIRSLSPTQSVFFIVLSLIGSTIAFIPLGGFSGGITGYLSARLTT